MKSTFVSQECLRILNEISVFYKKILCASGGIKLINFVYFSTAEVYNSSLLKMNIDVYLKKFFLFFMNLWMGSSGLFLIPKLNIMVIDNALLNQGSFSKHCFQVGHPAHQMPCLVYLNRLSSLEFTNIRVVHVVR